MGKRIFQCIAFSMLVGQIFFPRVVQGYVRSVGITGAPLFWSNPSVSYLLNPNNSSGLGGSDISTVFQNALNSWVNTGANISYSYSQSSNYPTGNVAGQNTVYFSSAGGRTMDFNIIASTEITYYVSTGQIANFDMVFNDGNFLFTNVAGDTGQSVNGRTKIYLGDVATHEIGHSWGLDHSTVLRSTLIYTAFSGQFTLGRDDITAIRTMYPPAGAVAQSGSINGIVRGTNGGIFGTHVSAVNLSTGAVEAGTLSNPDGSFRIGDLPPGKYVAYMEPFLVGVGTIAVYWNNIDHRFCGGQKFQRAFYSACGANGSATTIDVQAGAATMIGTLAPSCDVMENSGTVPLALANAKSIPSSGGAMFAPMDVGTSHFYSIQNISGTITARALSYTLFSPLDVQVEVLDQNAQTISGATSVDNVESPMPGGFTNYDSMAQANQLPLGNYIIKVSAQPNFLWSNLYPAGGQLLDGAGFYLLSVAVNGGFGSSGITDMSSCISVQNTQQSSFTVAAPNGADPNNLAGGCGMLADAHGAGKAGPPYSSSIALIFSVALTLEGAILVYGRRRRASPE